jgi:hypothetical protein
VTLVSGLELAAAALIFVGGVALYRLRDKSDGYGSQGAVLLFAAGALLAIHALRLMEYRPSKAEAEYIREHSQ